MSENTSMMAVEQSRAVEETQAALVIAKKFPRNEQAAADRILKACERKSLAATALYAYPRGDQVVTGPSIRMAEVMAQNWGNLDFGIRELSQGKNDEGKGESVVQAYCWDTEHNVKQEKVFTVPHWRHTKQGGYALKDPRDIYELVANNGARRLRACILGVIPGWVQDEAVARVEHTLAGGDSATPIADRVIKVVGMLQEAFGVTPEMVIAKLGHNLEACSETELVSLKAIGKTLKDGMAQVGAFFPELQPNTSTSKGKAGDLNAALDSEPEEAVQTDPAEKTEELTKLDMWIIDIKSLAIELAVEDLLVGIDIEGAAETGVTPDEYLDELISVSMDKAK